MKAVLSCLFHITIIATTLTCTTALGANLKFETIVNTPDQFVGTFSGVAGYTTTFAIPYGTPNYWYGAVTVTCINVYLESSYRVFAVAGQNFPDWNNELFLILRGSTPGPAGADTYTASYTAPNNWGTLKLTFNNLIDHGPPGTYHGYPYSGTFEISRNSPPVPEPSVGWGVSAIAAAMGCLGWKRRV